MVLAGSRSAPLAFEALRLDRAGRIRLHVRIDERSAGFLALGLAKVSGTPVVVICTSGTAVANLAPAVVEASYSAIPLVVLSADRPIESRGVGAPQTIDQVDFFGRTVRFFADLGAARRIDPEDPDSAQRAARASAGMAVAAAVRIDHSRVPAVSAGRHGPRRDRPPQRRVPAPARSRARSTPITRPAGWRWPWATPLLARADHLSPGVTPGMRARPSVSYPPGAILLVGDLPCTSLRGHHQWLAALADGCGWPIVAEPSANLHGAPTALGHGVLVLGSAGFLADHTPDIVLTVGQFGLSRPTMDLLRHAGRHVAIELPTVGREVCDPLRTAERVLPGIPLPASEVIPGRRVAGATGRPRTRLPPRS